MGTTVSTVTTVHWQILFGSQVTNLQGSNSGPQILESRAFQSTSHCLEARHSRHSIKRLVADSLASFRQED